MHWHITFVIILTEVDQVYKSEFVIVSTFFFLIVVYNKLYLLTKSVTTGTIKFYVLNTLQINKFIHLLHYTFRNTALCTSLRTIFYLNWPVVHSQKCIVDPVTPEKTEPAVPLEHPLRGRRHMIANGNVQDEIK